MAFYARVEQLLYVTKFGEARNIPLLLPASLNGASALMIPKQSCVNSGEILPWVGSGLCMVSFDPEAVTICCSLVPANCPSTADVIADGGCIVKLYMNIELVVAIVAALGSALDSPGGVLVVSLLDVILRSHLANVGSSCTAQMAKFIR